jgi:hypothetical protein
MAANTRLLQARNKKGETIAYVRAASLYDLQYIGGVPAEYLVGETLSHATLVQEKT